MYSYEQRHKQYGIRKINKYLIEIRIKSFIQFYFSPLKIIEKEITTPAPAI